MKSFDDFLSTLYRDDQKELINSAISSLEKSGITFSETDLKQATLTAQIIGTTTTNLLGKYHAWLSEQLH